MIIVLHYEKANKNKVIGYVDIKVPKWNNMIIRKIAHVQSGDRKWFNFPSFSRDRADGSKEYLKYWQFELESHNGQLLESLADKVKEYCDKHNIRDSAPLEFDKTFSNDLPF